MQNYYNKKLNFDISSKFFFIKLQIKLLQQKKHNKSHIFFNIIYKNVRLIRDFLRNFYKK